MDKINAALARYKPTTIVAGTVAATVALHLAVKVITDPKGA